jgi:hypothetical protein
MIAHAAEELNHIKTSVFQSLTLVAQIATQKEQPHSTTSGE